MTTLDLASTIDLTIQRREETLALAGDDRVKRLAALVEVGLNEEAIEAFELLVDLTPAIVLQKAVALQSLGHWTSVVDLARVASLETCSDSLRTIVAGAWAAYNLGDLRTMNQFRDIVSDRAGSDLSVLADQAYLDAFLANSEGKQPSEVRRDLDFSVATFRRQGESHRLCRALAFRSWLSYTAGQISEAQTDAIESLSIAASAGNCHQAQNALLNLGIFWFRRGELQNSIEAIESARTLDVVASNPKRAALVDLLEVRVHLRKSNTRSAVAALESARSKIDSEISNYATAVLHEYDGLVGIESHEPSRALESFTRSEEILVATGRKSYELAEIKLRRGQAHIDLNEFAEAYDVLTDALQVIAAGSGRLEIGHIYHARGIAAHYLGRPTEALQEWDRAERELRHLGDNYELALCLTTRAGLAIDRPAASRIADATEAVSIFERIGVPIAAERAQDILLVCEEKHRKEQELAVVPDKIPTRKKIVAVSEGMKQVLATARVAANSMGSALVTGETGTGKEVVANFIHEAGPRREKPFIAVNCSSIPENLLEREFFGHARGAYTGADADRPGLVEAAQGGTLFLDEIGEMPIQLQPKLLRILQEGTFRRVGDTKERKADVRIVAATNRDPMEQVKAKKFREDLFYRLAVFEIEIPPLRDRKDDIVPLIDHFLAIESRRSGIVYWMDSDVWSRLKRCPWPGNARELQAMVSSAAAHSGEKGRIQLHHFGRFWQRQQAMDTPTTTFDLTENLAARERELILKALHQAEYQRTLAAEILGIGRNTLYEKMKRHGIRPQSREEGTS